MRRPLTVVWALAWVLLCVSSSLAEAVWMDTMTANGTKYIGYVENGDLNGFGISTYGDGAKYYGMHANGLREGFGAVLFPEEGEGPTDFLLVSSVAGKYNGRGIIHWKNGRRYDGPYENDEKTANVGYTENEYGFVRDVPVGNGGIYTGEVLPDTTTPSGCGILVMQDGALYVGQFASGVREGYGLYLSSEKQVSSGIWERDELVDSQAEWK